MPIFVVLVVIACVLAFVAELRADGHDLTAWAVILVGIALLSGRLA